MSHYTANLRDLAFNLFEFQTTKDRFGTGPFEQMDTETARGVLEEVRRLAEGPLAESFVDADRNPPVFDPATSSVVLPESFKRSYEALIAGEWFRLDLPDSLGGFGAPVALRWAAYEMVLGANPAAFMYGSGPTFGATLHALGTPDQQRLAELMIERGWGATMVLTEPDAGSDVGAGRTRAVQQPDGSWHITGVKRFITSAEHDLSDNIIHLVLARPEGAKPGTKGLSLFVVPKFHVDLATGELGARNGAHVTNVEKKMGLKVSTTCELTFGDGPVPAQGWLVGDVHDGIAQMFRIIEYARMFVGTKAIATLSAGYSQALAYAKERVQFGTPIAAFQLTQRKLVEMMVKVEKAELVALHLGRRKDQGQLSSAQVSFGKMDNVREALWIAREARSILGANGITLEYPVIRHMNNLESVYTYEGTNEVHTLVLGQAITGFSAFS